MQHLVFVYQCGKKIEFITTRLTSFACCTICFYYALHRTKMPQNRIKLLYRYITNFALDASYHLCLSISHATSRFFFEE